MATDDEPAAYLPARSIETIGLQEILDAAPARGEEPARHRAVQALGADIDRSIAGSLEGKTLKDLVVADQPHPAQATPRGEETGATERP